MAYNFDYFNQENLNPDFQLDYGWMQDSDGQGENQELNLNQAYYQDQFQDPFEFQFENPQQQGYESIEGEFEGGYQLDYELDSQIGIDNVSMQDGYQEGEQMEYQEVCLEEQQAGEAEDQAKDQSENQSPTQHRTEIHAQDHIHYSIQPSKLLTLLEKKQSTPPKQREEPRPEVKKSGIKRVPMQIRSPIQYQEHSLPGDPYVYPIRKRRFCVVCGGRGFGVYYGKMVCEGCKSVFRRGLMREFECYENKNCDVHFEIKHRCLYCRFQKCLEAGMVGERDPQTEEKLEKHEVAQLVASLRYFHRIRCLLTKEKIEQLTPVDCNLNQNNSPNFTRADAWLEYSRDFCKDIGEFTFFVKKIPRLEMFRQSEKAFMIKSSMFSIYLLRNFRAISIDGLLLSDGRRIDFATLRLLYGNEIADEMFDISHQIREIGVVDDDIGLFIIVILTQVWRRNFARRDALRKVFKFHETLARREMAKRPYGNYLAQQMKEIIPKLDKFNESCKYMIEDLQPELENLDLCPLTRELFGLDWSKTIEKPAENQVEVQVQPDPYIHTPSSPIPEDEDLMQEFFYQSS